MGDRRSVPGWLLFLLPAAIWGTTWLVIKYQLGRVAPEVSVVWRFGLAGLLLLGWCALSGTRLRHPLRDHLGFAFLGALQFGLNYVLVYMSEQRLTSGLVAVVYVLMVVWNLLGARLIFGVREGAAVLGGAALGIVDVALVFLPELAAVRTTPELVVGIGVAVAGTLVGSAGSLWSQHLYGRGVEVVPSTAWGMLYAALAATSTLFEGYRWSAPALAGMALVVAGNVLVLRGRHPARA